MFFGSFHDIWGPAKPVEPAVGRPPTFPDNGVGRGVKIVVLDTGSVEHGSDDFDEPDEDRDRKLDFEAGHGVFIEGVIRRYAPSAEVVHRRVLTSNGRVSDTSLASELADCGDANIVNLSLGGYTYDNRGAYAFNRVLNQLRRENPDVALDRGGRQRPHRSAVLPGRDQGGHRGGRLRPENKDKRADYSNFGWWVDVRAQGDHVSTFYDIDAGEPHADLEAPGGLTLANFDGFASWAGTSFAAPVMAGAVAAKMTTDGLTSARGRSPPADQRGLRHLPPRARRPHRAGRPLRIGPRRRRRAPCPSELRVVVVAMATTTHQHSSWVRRVGRRG